MALDLDDFLSPRKPGAALPLDAQSVDELQHYILKLKEEIARAEAAIAAKQNHMAAADALFKR